MSLVVGDGVGIAKRRSRSSQTAAATRQRIREGSVTMGQTAKRLQFPRTL